jgi:hypothetical protein
MIIIRRYELIANAPIHATIVGKQDYKSGDREKFKAQFGFDPYSFRDWYLFLSSKQLPRRSPRGYEYVYQSYRWGQMSSNEPHSDKNYWCLYPGRRPDGTKRDIRTFGRLAPLES